MRLINATTLKLEDFSLKPKPKYAILSHTWEVDEEVSYHEMLDESYLEKKGWDKIRNTCTLALQNDLNYVWVDTCCIDKSSSAELSEAINSMFAWYQDAEECYAFLSDLSSDGCDQIENCRWWTRGWTLQELIAPRRVMFFDANWLLVSSREECSLEIARHTSIPTEVLCHEKRLSAISIAARMSWASKRSTTRKEDEAYCLLGLFGINMPLIYGEGTKAFIRLQEEIVKRSDDLSILAGDRTGNLLADSPRAFTACADVYTRSLWNDIPAEFSITSVGLRFSGQVELSVVACTAPGSGRARHVYALRVGTQGSTSTMRVYLCLRKVGPAVYERHPDFPSTVLHDLFRRAGFIPASQICILNRHYDTRDQIQVKDMSFNFAHTVRIRLSDGFELQAVRPQLLWDVERRYISDRFDYDPSGYFHCVNMAQVMVEHESGPIHVLVYWWPDQKLNARGWSGGGNLQTRVLHVTSKLEELERFLDRNRSNRIFMEDFATRFDIRNCSSSAKIESSGKSVTIQASLVQQDVVNVYDLRLNITDHDSFVNNGTIRTTDQPAHMLSRASQEY